MFILVNEVCKNGLKGLPVLLISSGHNVERRVDSSLYDPESETDRGN